MSARDEIQKGGKRKSSLTYLIGFIRKAIFHPFSFLHLNRFVIEKKDLFVAVYIWSKWIIKIWVNITAAACINPLSGTMRILEKREKTLVVGVE